MHTVNMVIKCNIAEIIVKINSDSRVMNWFHNARFRLRFRFRLRCQYGEKSWFWFWFRFRLQIGKIWSRFRLWLWTKLRGSYSLLDWNVYSELWFQSRNRPSLVSRKVMIGGLESAGERNCEVRKVYPLTSSDFCWSKGHHATPGTRFNLWRPRFACLDRPQTANWYLQTGPLPEIATIESANHNFSSHLVA